MHKECHRPTVQMKCLTVLGSSGVSTAKSGTMSLNGEVSNSIVNVLESVAAA